MEERAEVLIQWGNIVHSRNGEGDRATSAELLEKRPEVCGKSDAETFLDLTDGLW